MCGIIGILSKDFSNPVGKEKFVSTALFADMVRGAHGTGLYAYNNNTGETFEYKKALSSPDYLQLARPQAVINHMNRWNLVIGHNRHATQGAHTDLNSHPFTFGDITMVHNGSLTSWAHLSNKTFAVDSQYIAHSLSQNDNPIDTLSVLYGPYAVVWHNRKTNTLSFARNSQRPMSIFIADDDSLLMWASEYHMLKWVIERSFYTIPKGVYIELNTEVLYSINVNDLSERKATKYKMKPKSHTPPSNTWSRNEGSYNSRSPITPIRQQQQGMQRTPLQKRYNFGNNVIATVLDAYPYQPNNTRSRWYVTGMSNDVDAFPFIINGVNEALARRLLAHKHAISGVLVDDWRDPTDDTINLTLTSRGLQFLNSEETEAATTKERAELAAARAQQDIESENSELDPDNDGEDILNDLIALPNNKFISVERWRELAKHGCSYCTQDLDITKAADYIYVGQMEDMIVCENCCEDVLMDLGGSAKH